MPVQTPIQFRDAQGAPFSFMLPLVGVDSVRAMTGLVDYEVHAAVECGALLWAWNVGAGAERAHTKVWNRSVLCYLNPKLSQPDDLAGVLPYLLPIRSLTTNAIDSSELELILNISPDAVACLFESGAFVEHPSSASRAVSGPHGKRIATRASVERFFLNRRLPR